MTKYKGILSRHPDFEKERFELVKMFMQTSINGPKSQEGLDLAYDSIQPLLNQYNWSNSEFNLVMKEFMNDPKLCKLLGESIL